jgi:hypothetical protein
MDKLHVSPIPITILILQIKLFIFTNYSLVDQNNDK